MISPSIFVFAPLASAALFTALMVVRSRNVIHAGYWLLPCLLAVAGLFGSLEAHFFVVVQILIYAGAILILILFALMLTRDVMDPKQRQTTKFAPLAVPLCIFVGLGGALMMARAPWPAIQAAAPGPAEQTKALGLGLIGDYALPFEVASLILLAALIGAICLAKAEKEPAAPEPVIDLRGEIELEESVSAGAADGH